MKTLLIPFLLIVFCACNEQNTTENTITISGNSIKGLDAKIMYVVYENKEGDFLRDSILVNSGSFRYKANIDTLTHFWLEPKMERLEKRLDANTSIPLESSFFACLAGPGDNIIFKGEVTDFVNAYPSGTNTNNDLAKINSIVFPLMNKAGNLKLRANSLPKSDTIQSKLLNDSIVTLEGEVVRSIKRFVSSNLDSEAAAWYISDLDFIFSNEDLKALVLRMGSNSKDNPIYKQIEPIIKKTELTMLGKTLPDFTAKNVLDDSEFKFSSLRGKYVLIDFWGTWCTPCVKELPKIKTYKEKYKEKLVVLGINDGDKEEKAKEFITKNNYDWVQIFAGSGKDNLSSKFNIVYFPTKFIISPTGEILYNNSGDVYDYLDKLLKD